MVLNRFEEKPLKLIRWVLIILTFILNYFIIFSNSVRADMNPPYTFYSQSPISGIIFISFVNISINLFWFSFLLLLLCIKYGDKIGNIPKESDRFIISILVISVIITLIGACIDLIFLFEKGARYRLTYDTGRWIIASILTFLLIYGISFIILRINWKLDIILSGVIAILNPIWWFLILTFEEGAPCWSLIILLFIIPVILFLLKKWHTQQYIR